MNKSYSYHTFLFPFLWNDGGRLNWDDFKKVLSIGTRWVETSWKKEEIPGYKNETEWQQDYAAFQYFTEPANNVIFNTRGDNVLRCFEYRYNGKPIKNNGKYIVTKDKDIYQLNINCIRLHVYDIGVAILILELENQERPSLDAVNAINEYGRRINMPFLYPGKSHPVCADKIEITLDGKQFETENYLCTLIELAQDSKDKKKHISLNYIMSPIQKLLDGDGIDNGGYKVTSNVTHTELRKLFIKPCVDDRMFVCCIVVDEGFGNEVRKYDVDEKEYHYLSDCDLHLRDSMGDLVSDDEIIANKLYKFCHIETSPTCQSATMKKEILKTCIYDRWIDYGTYHAMTHHSFMCVSTDSSSINAFLTLYVQLAVLTLAQRAVILLLSGEASSVAEGFKDDVSITSEQICEIERLQAKYVKAQNQLLLSEITVQEQGVEIYNLIRKQLYIDTNKAELAEQLNNLRDVANISNERLERDRDRERVEREGRKEQLERERDREQAERDREQAEREHQLDTKLNLLAIAISLLAIFEPVSFVIKDVIVKFFNCTNVENTVIWALLDVVAVFVIWDNWKRKGRRGNGKNDDFRRQ